MSFPPLELVCHGPLDLQTQLLQISWLVTRERIIKQELWSTFQYHGKSELNQQK